MNEFKKALEKQEKYRQRLKAYITLNLGFHVTVVGFELKDDFHSDCDGYNAHIKCLIQTESSDEVQQKKIEEHSRNGKVSKFKVEMDNYTLKRNYSFEYRVRTDVLDSSSIEKIYKIEVGRQSEQDCTLKINDKEYLIESEAWKAIDLIDYHKNKYENREFLSKSFKTYI